MTLSNRLPIDEEKIFADSDRLLPFADITFHQNSTAVSITPVKAKSQMTQKCLETERTYTDIFQARLQVKLILTFSAFQLPH